MGYKVKNNELYYKLNNKELEKINKISNITFTNYELEGSYISIDSLITIIEDLLCEYDNKEEELEDLKRDVAENYKLKNVDVYDEYGVSPKDF